MTPEIAESIRFAINSIGEACQEYCISTDHCKCYEHATRLTEYLSDSGYPDA
jgi:hypothetical protein